MKTHLHLKPNFKKSILFVKAFYQKFLFVFAALTGLATVSLAQGNVAGSLDQISEWIVIIGNIVFGIIVVIGLIRTITKFVKGDPDALISLFGLIVAVALWGGFQFIQDDIANFVGGPLRLKVD